MSWVYTVHMSMNHHHHWLTRPWLATRLSHKNNLIYCWSQEFALTRLSAHQREDRWLFLSIMWSGLGCIELRDAHWGAYISPKFLLLLCKNPVSNVFNLRRKWHRKVLPSSFLLSECSAYTCTVLLCEKFMPGDATHSTPSRCSSKAYVAGRIESCNG